MVVQWRYEQKRKKACKVIVVQAVLNVEAEEDSVMEVWANWASEMRLSWGSLRTRLRLRLPRWTPLFSGDET